MVKQISLDAWQIQQLTDLLKKGSDIVAKTNRPIILYRQTLDEEDWSNGREDHQEGYPQEQASQGQDFSPGGW